MKNASNIHVVLAASLAMMACGAETPDAVAEPASTPQADIESGMDAASEDLRKRSAVNNPSSGAAIRALCEEADKPAAACDCGVHKLREELDEDDFAAFDRIVAAYREGQARGEPNGIAWQNAIGAEAARQNRSKEQMAALINLHGEIFQNAQAACAT